MYVSAGMQVNGMGQIMNMTVHKSRVFRCLKLMYTDQAVADVGVARLSSTVCMYVYICMYVCMYVCMHNSRVDMPYLYMMVTMKLIHQ